MKKVKWLINDRTIPNHGIARLGEEAELPDELADKFIKQGEAEEVKPKGRVKEIAND